MTYDGTITLQATAETPALTLTLTMQDADGAALNPQTAYAGYELTAEADGPAVPTPVATVAGTPTATEVTFSLSAEQTAALVTTAQAAARLVVAADASDGRLGPRAIYRVRVAYGAAEAGATAQEQVVAWTVTNDAVAITLFTGPAGSSGSGGDEWGDPVDANVIPDASGTRSLGSPSARFGFAYVDNADVLGSIAITGFVDGRDVSIDGAKLDTVEFNAKDDQTGAEIKTLYEAEPDTNAFTDSEQTKLSGIEASATANPTAPDSDPTGVTGADAVTNIISLTQAEYDAIGTPGPSTLYIITG